MGQARRPKRLRVALICLGAVFSTAFVLAIVLLTFAVQVSGSSMEATLKPGDRLFVNFLGGGEDVRRFDIVEARFDPAAPPAVKRVVGLPGDQVRIRIEGTTNVVEVRPPGQSWQRVGNAAWERAKDHRTCCDTLGRGSAGSTAATVPEGHAWLLGDNLDASDDSRTYGFVPLSDISASLNLRVLPLGRAGFIDHGDVRLER